MSYLSHFEDIDLKVCARYSSVIARLTYSRRFFEIFYFEGENFEKEKKMLKICGNFQVNTFKIVQIRVMAVFVMPH